MSARQFSTTPKALIQSVLQNRELILTLAKRDVISRYRGSLLGLFWSFFNPVLMLLVYTFVFSVVFRARWGSENENRAEFALVLFAGLIVFNLFAECLNRAPSLILSNVNYVKKIIFPLEVLPWVALASALFHATISLVVWLIFHIIVFGPPPASIVFLPIVVLPLLFLIIGLSWVVASLGVYLRDTSQVIGIVTTTLLFLSPIFYPASALPDEYRFLLYLNPLTQVVESTRNVLIWNLAPDWRLLSVYTILMTLIAWSGFYWFQKTRRGFADVL